MEGWYDCEFFYFSVSFIFCLFCFGSPVCSLGVGATLHKRDQDTRILNADHPTKQREEALTLVTAAISAGIFNDLGSGSNVDACVITAQGTEELRNFVKPNERVEKERRCVFNFIVFCLCCEDCLQMASLLRFLTSSIWSIQC